jgi:RHS repeat-associated protein
VHTNSIFSAYSSPAVSKGYTGHKMVNDMDIIHMNGRIYDPTLGRFLQADPHIQAPSNSQSYNRYAYVLNNPMSYTDPSGYFFKKIGKFFKKYWKVIAAAVVSYFTFGAASGWAASWALGSGFSASAAGFIGAMAGGAAAGFVSGAIMTGSLKGALKGAFIGAATAGIFEGVAQYGFGTSTVGIAAQAMRLEQLGVSRDTIVQLYGNNGQQAVKSSQEYWSAVEKGAGNFTKEQAQQLQDALSTVKTNTSSKIKLLEQGKDNVGLTKNFGSLKNSSTVLSRSKQILKLANTTGANSFVSANGFCGGNAFACVAVNDWGQSIGNHVFIDQSFFNTATLSANSASQAGILTHEFAHLTGAVHSLRYATTNVGIIAASQNANAVINAESYTNYLIGH